MNSTEMGSDNPASLCLVKVSTLQERSELLLRGEPNSQSSYTQFQARDSGLVCEMKLEPVILEQID